MDLSYSKEGQAPGPSVEFPLQNLRGIRRMKKMQVIAMGKFLCHFSSLILF